MRVSWVLKNTTSYICCMFWVGYVHFFHCNGNIWNKSLKFQWKMLSTVSGVKYVLIGETIEKHSKYPTYRKPLNSIGHQDGFKYWNESSSTKISRSGFSKVCNVWIFCKTQWSTSHIFQIKDSDKTLPQGNCQRTKRIILPLFRNHSIRTTQNFCQ